MVDEALAGLLVAFVLATVLTPAAGRVAILVGAVDVPRARGLAQQSTPLLGGLAIFAGAGVAGLLFLPDTGRYHSILIGAALITAVGAIDDRLPLPAVLKLAGQLSAALILVLGDVTVDIMTIPFVGRVDFGDAGGPLTVVGLLAIMNAVNFTDGMDGLASGVCAISAATFAIIAFSLSRDGAGVLALITCGAALGFLVHNFPPARIFMGDCGSNLLGLLLGATIVEGSLKTTSLVALIVPLLVLAVPFLDTTFVVLKRMKYHRPVYSADANHFHHRFARIGFSQRKTVAYLYGWASTMAAVAIAMRYVPYSDDHGNFHAGWTALMAVFLLLGLAFSVYVVYTLEILKFKRFRMRAAPGTSEFDIEQGIERDLETGEWDAGEA
ncbi:MAG: UDP-GlcNAc:undecaprenyl-phosphate/decaprenyl-phosphate GlcNAc-phosphate transferase [Solirubrobacteraceae bacterium]|jgi:UDP-GlcNAc:undecaprenyl-phosphate GlcNAc-1-phosphate transferase|nr:UDP-GlcNAc:undecaprenyl-phosphate/decaprenyl-phosphate GlcNAc-phosphate transferase [Solirubrobacteraceae bacterium]